MQSNIFLHTPGPWVISWETFNQSESHGIYKDGELDLKGYQIAIVNHWPTLDNVGDQAGKANAKLIAAAPDMLQALIDVRKVMLETGMPEVFIERFYAINKVLAKAVINWGAGKQEGPNNSHVID